MLLSVCQPGRVEGAHCEAVEHHQAVVVEVRVGRGPAHDFSALINDLAALIERDGAREGKPMKPVTLTGLLGSTGARW